MPAIPWNTGEELGKLADVRLRRGEQQLRAFGQLGGAIGTGGRILRESNDLETAQESELAALAAANDTGATPEDAAAKAEAASNSTGQIDKPVTTDAVQPPVGAADKQVGGAPPAGVEKVATPGTASHDVQPSKQPDGSSPQQPTQDNSAQPGPPPTTKAGASNEAMAKEAAEGRKDAGASALDKTALYAKGIGDKSISALGKLGGAVFGDVRRIGRTALDVTGLHPDAGKRARAIEIGRRKGVSMALDREQKNLTALGSLGIMGRAKDPFGALAEYAPRGLGRLANSKQAFFDPGYGKTATGNIFSALQAAYPNDPARVLREYQEITDILKNPIDQKARTTAWLLRQPPEYQRDFAATFGDIFHTIDPMTQMLVEQLERSQNLTPDERTALQRLKYQLGWPGGVAPPKQPPVGGKRLPNQYPGDPGAGAAAGRGSAGAAAGGDDGGAGSAGGDQEDPRAREQRLRFIPDPNSVDVAPLDPLFKVVEEKYQLPLGILSAMAEQESGFRLGRVSEKGARGLMQIMPATAGELGVNPDNWREAVMGAGHYLRQKLDENNGDLPAALNAYGGVVRSGFPYAQQVLDRLPKYAAARRPSTSAPVVAKPAAPVPSSDSGAASAAEPPAAPTPPVGDHRGGVHKPPPAVVPAPGQKPPPAAAAKPAPGKAPLADLGNRGKPKPGQYRGIPLETPDAGGGASFNGIPLETPDATPAPKPTFKGIPLETPTTSTGPPKATVNTGGAMPASEPTQAETPSSAASTPTTSSTTTTLGQLGMSESPDVTIADPNSGMISSEQPRRRAASRR